MSGLREHVVREQIEHVAAFTALKSQRLKSSAPSEPRRGPFLWRCCAAPVPTELIYLAAAAAAILLYSELR